MNGSNGPQQNPGAPAAPSEVSGSGLIKNYDQRAAEVFGDESTLEGAPGQAQDAIPPAEGATPGAPPSDEAQRRADRRKQIAAAMAQERARIDAQARFRQGDEAQRRAEAAERERDQLKQQIASRIDPASLDEKGFFDLAERLQVAPKKLGEWLQQRATHPEVIAAQVAQRAVDPKISALEAKLAEQNAELQRINQERMTERQTQEAYERGESMLSFTQQAAAQAPLAAALLREAGPEEFLTLANSAYASVPKGPGWEQHVLDLIEDDLVAKRDKLLAIFSPQPGGIPQQRQAPPNPHRGAAKPMTTISNTLAQGRAAVVNEEADWSSLSYDERAKRVFGD